MIKNVGIEDLYIEKIHSASHTIYFRNSAYCWIKNVESYKTRKTHVEMISSLGNEIRDSYFHLSYDYGGGGSGYGVKCGLHVTNCLVENNTFDSLRHAMLLALGANGNVYAYNYSTNPVGAAAPYAEEGWIPADISIHGHYPFMNLFEGNEVYEIGIGDYWGPAGPGNTYFRNKVNDEGIFYYDASNDQNLIGNVISYLTDDGGMIDRKLEHGNVINSITHWDPSIPNHQLPASLYLESAPDFFYGQPWPCFGPDINEERTLPAQHRVEELK
jgi:hypothetical protein